ncbi:MAG: TetR/AcrR family transcriptional regulator [Peptostreptococcus sp.]|uniref:TetR/AcrR family transcriptional regulator n=1 Tax=Peptostreptococcus sp. TaxID=1262 RepID=UPI002FC9A963
MENLSSYKRGIMKSLINSAREIMQEEGLDSITIRKVGERARLNSATIYNYFENLEHLKIFACLFVFDEYIDDIQHYIKEDDNIVENYFAIWECFVKHTIMDVEVYYNIFFNKLEREISEYVEEYYLLFPFKNKDYGEYIDKMLKNSSVEKRNIILLEEISNRGHLKREDIEWINDLSVYTYESILFRVYKSSMGKDEGAEKMKEYAHKILESNMIK